MKKEYIIAAKTVEEAITDARIKYGSEGELSFEVLEMPKKGFLGIGSSPAKIKVTVEEEEEDLMAIFGSTKKEARKPEPKKEEKKEPAKKRKKRTRATIRTAQTVTETPRTAKNPRKRQTSRQTSPHPKRRKKSPFRLPAVRKRLLPS